MDSKHFCDEILKMDNKIRATAIYDEGIFYHKMKDGLKSYLTQEETEISLAQAVYRWASRKKMAPKIGQPIYSMAKYERIYRVTIPVGKAVVLNQSLLVSNLGTIDTRYCLLSMPYEMLVYRQMHLQTCHFERFCISLNFSRNV